MAGLNESRFAHGDDQNFRASGVPNQITGVNMADGDGGTAFGKQKCGGAAGDATGTDHGNLRALQRYTGRVNKGHCRQGGAGRDDGVSIEHIADIGGVDAFNIF